MQHDKPFALGGVWRPWRSPDGKHDMDTFAIITVESNDLVVETTGHDRYLSSLGVRMGNDDSNPAIRKARPLTFCAHPTRV